MADQLYNWSECRASLGIVNPFLQEFDQLTQLDQAGRMQDGGLRQHSGGDRRRSVVGPLAGQSDHTAWLIEEGKDFATSNTPHLQDQESFSPQRMKRVGDGRPSQIPLGVKCS